MILKHPQGFTENAKLVGPIDGVQQEVNQTTPYCMPMDTRKERAGHPEVEHLRLYDE